MDERLIRLPEVSDMTGSAEWTLRRMVRAGTFPRPVKIGERAIAWRLSEVQQWIKDRPQA